MSENRQPATAPERQTQDGARPGWVRFLPLVWPGLVLVALAVTGLFLPLDEIARDLLKWAGKVGWLGPLFITAGYVLTSLLILPTSVFTFGAGFIYGLPGGMAVAVVGSTVGALASYGVSRLLLARRVMHYARRVRPLAIVRRATRADGKKVLLLTRMSPLTPFAFLSYFYGALQVGLWRFLWTTALGMLPGTFLCVYIGTGLRDLAEVTVETSGRVQPSWPYWIGLAGTAVAVVLIGHFARKALLRAADRMEEESAEEQRRHEPGGAQRSHP